jgi:hypothetical protein
MVQSSKGSVQCGSVGGWVQVRTLIDSLHWSRTGSNLDQTMDWGGQMVLGFAKNGKPINHFWCQDIIDNDQKQLFQATPCLE